MSDSASARASVSRILLSLDQGIRSFDQTFSNIKSVLDALPQPIREECLEDLFRQLVNLIRARSVTNENERNKRRQSIGIHFKVLFEYGLVEKTLCRVIAFLDPNSPDVANNWREFVYHEVVHGVKFYSDALTQNALDTLKEHAALFLLRGTELARMMPALLPYVGELNRAIENVEFTRFEKQLRASKPVETASNTVTADIDSLDPAVAAAMKKAADYLHSEGVFSPKTAADLIRASMEESHRALVSRIAVITGTTYTGVRDGDRRAYLRKAAFITEPEEKFFSSIYKLLSEEGSHKLIAPRETVLLMWQVVHSYLLLLVRRLSSFPSPGQIENP